MPKRFSVGEIWKGPTGGIWLVKHLTSDGDVVLRNLGDRPNHLRRINQVPKGWALFSAPEAP